MPAKLAIPGATRAPLKAAGDSPGMEADGRAPVSNRSKYDKEKLPRTQGHSVWTTSTLIAILAIASIFLYLILRYFFHTSKIAWEIPLIVALIAGGIPLIVPLTRRLLAKEFGADHLAGISIITATVLGEYLVGVIVILMLSGGTALEQFAGRRASSVLDALARRRPQVAHCKVGANLSDVKLADVLPGDLLVIFPHEICPVDGVVVEGRGKMNEAYLTGEPFEIEKAPGAQVLSGAVNGDIALYIRAEKLAKDSRYARIPGYAGRGRTATSYSEAWRQTGSLVHANRSWACEPGLGVNWRATSISRRCGRGHALPIADRDSRGCHWCDIARGAARHHH